MNIRFLITATLLLFIWAAQSYADSDAVRVLSKCRDDHSRNTLNLTSLIDKTAPATTLTVEVKEVCDGDTVRVSIKDYPTNDPIKENSFIVRLSAIDAPETYENVVENQECADGAILQLKQLVSQCKNNHFTLTIERFNEVDLKGRLLGKLQNSAVPGSAQTPIQCAQEDLKSIQTLDCEVKTDPSQYLDMNLEMVKRGFAWHYKRFQWRQNPKERKTYTQAESSAREAKVGVWKNPDAVPPWFWRTEYLYGGYDKYTIDPYQLKQATILEKDVQGSSWESAILLGLSDAITEIAQESIIDWYLNEVSNNLCDKSRDFFPHLCAVRDNLEKVTITSNTLLVDMLRKDVENLPAALAARIYQKHSDISRNGYWVYVIGGLLANIRKGGSVQKLVAGLADNEKLKNFCLESNEHACALLLSSILVKAHLRVKYDQSLGKKTDDNELSEVNLYIKTVKSLLFQYEGVLGNCDDKNDNQTYCGRLMGFLNHLHIPSEFITHYHQLLAMCDASSNGVVCIQRLSIGQDPLQLIAHYKKLYEACKNSPSPNKCGIPSNQVKKLEEQFELPIWRERRKQFITAYHRLEQLATQIKDNVKSIESARDDNTATNKQTIYQSALNVSTTTIDIIRVASPMFGKHHPFIADLDQDLFFQVTHSMAAFFAGEYSSGLSELLDVLDTLEKTDQTKYQKVAQIIKQRVSFLIDIASISSRQEAKQAILSVASPVGAWRLKRNTTMLSFGALAGGMYANEKLTSELNDNTYKSPAYGLFMPVGFDLSTPWCNTSWTVGAFVSFLDLGALATLRDSDPESSAKVDNVSNVGLEQVVSPGLFIRIGLGNSPWVFGFGQAKTPKLRSVELTGTSEEIDFDSTRNLVFLAIDVPLFVF